MNLRNEGVVVSEYVGHTEVTSSPMVSVDEGVSNTLNLKPSSGIDRTRSLELQRGGFAHQATVLPSFQCSSDAIGDNVSGLRWLRTYYEDCPAGKLGVGAIVISKCTLSNANRYRLG